MALVGFMGAGKTTIGRLVARELELPFLDTDELIVARHGPVASLFERGGEGEFRAREFEAVRDALSGPPAVVALGGGAVTHEPTRRLVAERALRVYLEIPLDILTERLQRSHTVRPLVGSRPGEQRVGEILRVREPLYREAEIVTRGPRETKHAFAREIARLVRASQGVPPPGHGPRDGRPGRR